MKYETLPQFTADYAKLSAAEKSIFREFLREQMIPACKLYAADPKHYKWPAALRFEKMKKTRGVFAVTWSFSGPDGRATFHFETRNGEVFLVWRRVGRHAIYAVP